MKIRFSYDGFSSDITVIKSNRKTAALTVKSNGIFFRVPNSAKRAEIEIFIQSKASWIKANAFKVMEAKQRAGETAPLTPEEIASLKAQAKEYISKRAAYYAHLIGVDYAKIAVRSQKTRWGSCSSNGNLSFNCLLVLLPSEIIDSVVVHELCHRKQMNHSPAFYREIERVFPDYARCRQWLKENGSAYLARLPE